MAKLAPILCLLAIAAVQVPSVACANGCPEDPCRDVIVSAAHSHDCETTHEHHHGHHHHGHHHGHHHHGHSHSNEDAPSEPHRHGAVHEVLQSLVVKLDHSIDMPEHTRSAQDVDLTEAPLELPSQLNALEAAHEAEPDPVPVPLPASVRLLL